MLMMTLPFNPIVLHILRKTGDRLLRRLLSAGVIEVDNSEELDEESVDDPSGTGSSEVPNHCPQCGKGFSTPGNLSAHIKGVHGPKKECSYCHKMINPIEIKRHIGTPAGPMGISMGK